MITRVPILGRYGPFAIGLGVCFIGAVLAQSIRVGRIQPKYPKPPAMGFSPASTNFGIHAGLTGARVSVTVNWSSAQQAIDGFGAAIADSGSDHAVDFTSSDYDFFFTNTGSNIGLSLVRVQVIPSNADCIAWPGGSGGPGCLSTSNATILQGELTMAQAAAARGVNVFATEWSPTAAFKRNGVYAQGGSLITNTSNYASIGSTLASFVTLLASHGVPVYAIGIQNEPNISENYPSCTWTAQQFHDVIPYVASALASAGVSSTFIMFPENSTFASDYEGFIATTMTDSSVAPDVGILAQHGYAGSNIVAPSKYGYGQHVWMTEISSTSPTYDGSMSDALGWAQNIHSYLATANVSAYVWWFISNRPGEGNGADNSALTDYSGNIPKRTYVTGQWSKFVRPGWHRVDVTNSGSLLVTAFQSADNRQSAIVVVNAGSTETNQAFTVGTQMGTSVTPWITSSRQSLTQQTPVTVSGGCVAYTIPANSVVTFVGQTTD